jgi:hypothetical protein
MKIWLDDRFQMPDKTVDLLICFLEQNNGTLSKRARDKEFAALTDQEISTIEEGYISIMFNNIMRWSPVTK